MAMSFCPFPRVSVTTVQSGDGSGLDAAESSDYRGDSKEGQPTGFSRRLLGVRKGRSIESSQVPGRREGERVWGKDKEFILVNVESMAPVEHSWEDIE